MPRASRSAIFRPRARLAARLCLALFVLALAAPREVGAAPAKPTVVSPKSPPPPVTKAPTGAVPAGESPPSAAKPDAAAVDTGRRETEIYGDRLDGLQHEVDDLKDRIFRSKARLSLLKETVLHGVLAGSRIVLVHRNVMSSQFRLAKVAVILDGAQIYARNDSSEQSGGLDSEDELIVFDGNLVPGPHNVTVELTYRGHGFGMFSYLNNYTFDSRSSHSFIAPEDGALRVLSVGFESGNLTTEMKDRPSVDWQEIPLDSSGRPLPAKPERKRKAGRAGGGAAGKRSGKDSPGSKGEATAGEAASTRSEAAPASSAAKSAPAAKPKQN